MQRWERDLHLPVHRIGRGKRSPVYAKVAELKFWLATSDVRQEYDVHATALNHALVAAPGPMLVGERASAKSLKRHDTCCQKPNILPIRLPRPVYGSAAKQKISRRGFCR